MPIFSLKLEKTNFPQVKAPAGGNNTSNSHYVPYLKFDFGVGYPGSELHLSIWRPPPPHSSCTPGFSIKRRDVCRDHFDFSNFAKKKLWKCNTAVAAGSNNSDTAVAAGSNSSNTAVAAGSNSSITAVAAVAANFQLVETNDKIFSCLQD